MVKLLTTMQIWMHQCLLDIWHARQAVITISQHTIECVSTLNDMCLNRLDLHSVDLVCLR
jgi:hypothetical protein